MNVLKAGNVNSCYRIKTNNFLMIVIITTKSLKLSDLNKLRFQIEKKRMEKKK